MPKLRALFVIRIFALNTAGCRTSSSITDDIARRIRWILQVCQNTNVCAILKNGFHQTDCQHRLKYPAPGQWSESILLERRCD